MEYYGEGNRKYLGKKNDDLKWEKVYSGII
jgi:hypothetical protein